MCVAPWTALNKGIHDVYQKKTDLSKALSSKFLVQLVQCHLSCHDSSLQVDLVACSDKMVPTAVQMILLQQRDLNNTLKVNHCATANTDVEEEQDWSIVVSGGGSVHPCVLIHWSDMCCGCSSSPNGEHYCKWLPLTFPLLPPTGTQLNVTKYIYSKALVPRTWFF